MSLTNPLGDVPLTDPKAMRALAHPVRLAILSFLQRSGPATATMLAPHVSATPSVVSWHLRHLAEFGLVADADPADVPGDRRQRWWVASARGFRFEGSDDPAAEQLADEMFTAAVSQTKAWIMETRPQLPMEWRPNAGLSNTRVSLTPDELDQLADEIDNLLAPYVNRPTPPDGARPVRILRHYMPLGEGE
jgi:DNA-binding transcriptional ArsR family regulator